MVLKKVSVIATLPGDVAVGNPKTLNVQSYVKSYVKSTFNMHLIWSIALLFSVPFVRIT